MVGVVAVRKGVNVHPVPHEVHRCVARRVGLHAAQEDLTSRQLALWISRSARRITAYAWRGSCLTACRNSDNADNALPCAIARSASLHDAAPSAGNAA